MAKQNKILFNGEIDPIVDYNYLLKTTNSKYHELFELMTHTGTNLIKVNNKYRWIIKGWLNDSGLLYLNKITIFNATVTFNGIVLFTFETDCLINIS